MQRLHHKRFWQRLHRLLSSEILFTFSWLHRLVYDGGEAKVRTNIFVRVRDWRTAILSSSSFDHGVISVIISSPIVFFCLRFISTYSQMQCVTTTNCWHAEIIILSINSQLLLFAIITNLIYLVIHSCSFFTFMPLQSVFLYIKLIQIEERVKKGVLHAHDFLN